MTIAFRPPTASEARFAKARAWHPLWIAFALTALATALRFFDPVDSDVAWQLWIAQRIHGGARLYIDIVEVNPPLWFWMAIPVERLASFLQLRIEQVLIFAIGAAVALSLAATNRLIGSIPSRQRAALLGYAAITLLVMPWMHIGQREQIVLIGALPYTALIAARRDRRPVSWGLAFGVGVGFALGLALKHYFLVVPILLELWLFVSARQEGRLLRPENFGIALVGALYAIALPVFAGAFFTDIVPLARLAYGDLKPPGLIYLLGPGVLMSVAALLLVLANSRNLARARSSLCVAYTMATLGFAAAYFMQAKGWVYHSIPLLGCASVALAALLVEVAALPLATQLLAPAILCLPFAAAMTERSSEIARDRDLLQAVAGLPPYTQVGFIAENTAVAWSVTLQREFAYPSRYNGYWMLSAVVRNERAGNPDPRLAWTWRQVVANTVADFRCMPPRRIIIARPQRGTWNENTIDPLPYFLRNPVFAELLTHYRPNGRTTLEVYEQVSPLRPINPAACIRGH